jgi:PAS domain S-box-containing protein
LYRLVLQNINDAVILVGIDRRIQFVNPNFLNITGFEPAEVVGKEFDFLIYFEDRHFVGEYYAARMHGSPAPMRYKFRFVKKSGEVGLAEYNVATIYDGEKISGLLGVARDITNDQSHVSPSFG